MNDKAIEIHKKLSGKIEICPKIKIKDNEDLSLVYTPGVAEVSKEISKYNEKIYDFTMKANTVAIVTDGTAVLGLGNIGPEAALPVMEGKAMLFKQFGNVNAVPICLNTTNTEEIIDVCKKIAPAFGGINLEDISAPRCFDIEQRLMNELDIPVFHDDQHGTAIAVCAALENALKIVKKQLDTIKIIVNGAGSAGISIVRLLMKLGAKNIVVVDKYGILNVADSRLNNVQKGIALITNPEKVEGTLEEALINADVFIGVSIGNILNKAMISSMNKDAIVFALANPIPEIYPEEAIEAGACIVATGRSDFPNQINNVLVFPGIFYGLLNNRIKKITEEMMVDVVHAIASLISEKELQNNKIIPDVFDQRIKEKISSVFSLYR